MHMLAGHKIFRLDVSKTQESKLVFVGDISGIHLDETQAKILDFESKYVVSANENIVITSVKQSNDAPIEVFALKHDNRANTLHTKIASVRLENIKVGTTHQIVNDAIYYISS